MDRSRCMFGRGVDAGRDLDEAIRADPAPLAIEDRGALARDEDQDLVDVGVDLLAAPAGADRGA